MGASSVSNFVASMILSIATLWYPGYEYQHWQQWLVYVVLIWIAIAFNIFGSLLIPIYNKLTCTYLSRSPDETFSRHWLVPDWLTKTHSHIIRYCPFGNYSVSIHLQPEITRVRSLGFY
jgi:hypothetical protein